MAFRERSGWAGFAAGALGGAVGTAVLIAFQTGSLKGTERVEDALGTGHSNSREQAGLGKMFEDAHIKTAEALTEPAGIHLSRKQKKAAAPITEFAFGILCAGAYGALAEYVPEVTAGYGSIYGAALFTGASEVVLPALGWVPKPQKRTAVQHVGGMAGNIVYGLVTEAVRRRLR